MKNHSMRLFIASLFLMSSSVSYSQLTDKFTVGDYAEVFGDSIKIFFNSDGRVSSKSCAVYYRTGKIAPTDVNIGGAFNDYYLNGNIQFSSTMKNGMLEGPAKNFHENGTILAAGFYSENLRDSIWTFFYEDGKAKATVRYLRGEPSIVNAFTNSGEQTVKNGEGILTTEFNYPDQAGKIFISKGKIQNGKMNGRWQFMVPGSEKPIGYEDFNEGKFISAYPDVYTDSPRIGLIRYFPNENSRWFDNINAMCPSTTKRIVMYNGWGPTRGYFKELENRVTQQAAGIANQWFFIGLKISKNNKLRQIDVASSINDQSAETMVQNILSRMKNWEAARNQFGPVDSEIFFTLFVHQGKAQVPTQILSDRFTRANGLK